MNRRRDEEISSSNMKVTVCAKPTNSSYGHKTGLRQKPDRFAQNGYPRIASMIKFVLYAGLRYDVTLLSIERKYMCGSEHRIT